jgi:hypothetical protein
MRRAHSFGNGCKISLVSIRPEVTKSVEKEGRNWLPLAIAAGVVVLVAAVTVLLLEHGKKPATITPINAPLDAYAASLEVGALQMSESSNLAGGKVTYVDGKIRNTGQKIVVGITVQVLFHSFTKEVAQNDTQPMKLIRTKDPYVDVEPVSAAPLKPGETKEFRLSFDTVSTEWDGAYPEIRILKVETK